MYVNIYIYIYIYIYISLFLLRPCRHQQLASEGRQPKPHPGPPCRFFLNLKTTSIRLLYTVHESDGKVASNTNNPRRSLNRTATQAQTQERPTAMQKRLRKTGRYRDGSLNRRATQAKTKKTDGDAGDDSRKTRTERTRRTCKKELNPGSQDLKCSLP